MNATHAAQPLPHRADLARRRDRRQLCGEVFGGAFRAATSPRSSCRPTAWTRPRSRPSPSGSCRSRRMPASRRSSPSDTRIAGRVKADGIHVEGGKAAACRGDRKLPAKMMVGAGGAKTRDDALELGEERPDYIFFGRFGYDNKPEPHHAQPDARPLVGGDDRDPCHRHGRFRHRLGRGGGRDRRRIRRAVERGLRRGVDPQEAVARANAILDETAPRFEADRVMIARRLASGRPALVVACSVRAADAVRRPIRRPRRRRLATAGATNGATRAPANERRRRDGTGRRPGALRRAAGRRRLRRLPARPLHDRAQSRHAARRSRRLRRADARRRDPVARARRRARRGQGRQMVPARRRAGRARGAVPVCAAAARRAVREEGRAAAPMR